MFARCDQSDSFKSGAPMPTPDQLRAAHALVKWSRDDLADKAKVAAVTVKGFELHSADSKI